MARNARPRGRVGGLEQRAFGPDAPKRTVGDQLVGVVVGALVLVVLGFGVYRLIGHFDASSAVITTGDPARHAPAKLVFTGQVVGTVNQLDNAVGTTSLSPTPVDGFIPLTACSVLDLNDSGQNRGWVGELDLEGSVSGRRFVLRMYTDFTQTGLRSLPPGVYTVDPATPDYPHIYVGLYFEDGKVAMADGTLGSAVIVDNTGRAGRMDLGFTDVNQKGTSSPALVHVKGAWSCG